MNLLDLLLKTDYRDKDLTFISTTFIHTQLHSMRAKYRLKILLQGEKGCSPLVCRRED